MKQVIYIDVLVSVNFLVDYMLLYATGKFVSGKISRVRLALGALAGGASSCIILLPRLPFLLTAVINIAIAAVMTAAAFGFGGWRKFLKTAGVMLLCTVCYGGLMFALWLLVSPGGLEVRNGVVYINISPGLLIGATVLCYAALSVFGRITSRRNVVRSSCSLRIETERGTASISGVIDTGNLLAEPFSGYPVVIAEQGAVEDIIPVGVMEAIVSGRMSASQRGVRVIPFSSVGGEGMMYGFRPALLTVESGGRAVSTDKVFIGVLTSGRVSRESSAIVNPDVLMN